MTITDLIEKYRHLANVYQDRRLDTNDRDVMIKMFAKEELLGEIMNDLEAINK